MATFATIKIYLYQGTHSIILRGKFIIYPSPATVSQVRKLMVGVLSAALLVLPTPTITAHAFEPPSRFFIRFGQTPQLVRPAINAAAYIWSLNFSSKIPVTINVFLKANQTIDNLSSGTPTKYFTNFPGAKLNNVAYPAALANILAGKDLTNGAGEINIYINPNYLNEFYFGTDGQGPSTKYDFETIMLHEIAHGLGMISGGTSIQNYGSFSPPTIFDAFIVDSNKVPIVTIPNGLALGNEFTSPLFWNGPLTYISNNHLMPKIYSPTVFDSGSSLSHFDPYSPSTLNYQLFYPNLEPGFVFHKLSKEEVAMFQDLLGKPELGAPTSPPSAPINSQVLAGDSSAQIQFTAPVNAFASQIQGYAIKVLETGKIYTATQSPITVSNLTNGKSYNFQLYSYNSMGNSAVINLPTVTPQSGWVPNGVISGYQPSHLTLGQLGGNNVIALGDQKTNQLILLKQYKSTWIKTIIDGPGNSFGNSVDKVNGYLSLCLNTGNVKNVPAINIFYQDLTNSTLKYAYQLNNKWVTEVVDGDGTPQNNLTSRGKSNDSVGNPNTCQINQAGLQVFYRDENQGNLIGAVKVGNNWKYEIVDGNSTLSGKTTNDVASHLASTLVGNRIFLIYDGVSAIDQNGVVTASAIQIASRKDANPENWSYASFDNSDIIPSAGYSTAASNDGNNLFGSWYGTSAKSFPNPDTLRILTIPVDDISKVGANYTPTLNNAVFPEPIDGFGQPENPISITPNGVFFNCANRICNYDFSSKKLSLVIANPLTAVSGIVALVNNASTQLVVASSNKIYLFKK